MKGETRILQQRVQVAPVDRCRDQPVERVGRADDEGERAKAEQSLDRQGARPQRHRQRPTQSRDEPAEEGQHQDPEHHRAFVAAPDPGHLVEHRLGGVGVLEDVPHREIRNDVGVHKDPEGERHESELHQCGGSRQVHQWPAAHGRADERQDALHQRHEEREHEREMPELYEHAADLTPQTSTGWLKRRRGAEASARDRLSLPQREKSRSGARNKSGWHGNARRALCSVRRDSDRHSIRFDLLLKWRRTEKRHGRIAPANAPSGKRPHGGA